MARVLVVDDESRIVEMARLYLERDGHDVSTASDGQEAIERFRAVRPDIVVLDLMLPLIDGFEVCRRIRAESGIPVIMLTARTEEVDKLVGLELGADDYMTKPFSPRELAARVRAVLRRSNPQEPATPDRSVVGALVVDGAAHEARCGSRLLDLTPTEFRILAVLAAQPGRVFTREQLLDAALGERATGYDRSIDAHIKNLRRKLRPADGPGCGIATVFGVGYRLEVTR